MDIRIENEKEQEYKLQVGDLVEFNTVHTPFIVVQHVDGVGTKTYYLRSLNGKGKAFNHSNLRSIEDLQKELITYSTTPNGTYKVYSKDDYELVLRKKTSNDNICLKDDDLF